MLFQICHNLTKLRFADYPWPHFVLSIEGAQKESREWRDQGKMSTNRYLGVNQSPMGPEENPRRFTSQWAIPRAEPSVEPKPKRKKRQFNNIVLLFIIFVFKQAKKLFSSGSNRA
jgi:hypothetical protein